MKRKNFWPNFRNGIHNGLDTANAASYNEIIRKGEAVMIKRKAITEPYMYGVIYYKDDHPRHAEVVRVGSHPDTWNVFRYNNGRQIGLGWDEPDCTKHDAVIKAREYVEHGILPERA